MAGGGVGMTRGGVAEKAKGDGESIRIDHNVIPRLDRGIHRLCGLSKRVVDWWVPASCLRSGQARATMGGRRGEIHIRRSITTRP